MKKMQEKTLRNLALLGVLLGLAALYLFAEEVDVQRIASLDTVDVEETVFLAGEVTNVRQLETVVFLEVTGQRAETMQITFFPKEEVLLHVGDFVEVEGVVDEYRGQTQVIAEQVVVK
jgi:DNA/RNA endonuclease YhcR with UshA esterase domain